MHLKSVFSSNQDMDDQCCARVWSHRVNWAYLSPQIPSQCICDRSLTLVMGLWTTSHAFFSLMESWLLTITSTPARPTGLFFPTNPHLWASHCPWNHLEKPHHCHFSMSSIVVPRVFVPHVQNLPISGLPEHSCIPCKHGENNLPQLFILSPGFYKVLVFPWFLSLSHRLLHSISRLIQQALKR